MPLISYFRLAPVTKHGTSINDHTLKSLIASTTRPENKQTFHEMYRRVIQLAEFIEMLVSRNSMQLTSTPHYAAPR
jgi:hypothetical protein